MSGPVTFVGRVIDREGHEVRLIWDGEDYPPVGTEVAVSWHVPPSYLGSGVVDGHVFWMTWAGEMRGRSDLARWEYADPAEGWVRMDSHMADAHLGARGVPDDFPIVIRRRT